MTTRHENRPVIAPGTCLSSGNFAACCRLKAMRRQPDSTCKGVPPMVLGGPGRQGQASQTVYLPGLKTSAAGMSEALPPGVHGGASEVARGIFGPKGANVLVPRASQTVTVRDLPKPPLNTMVGVPDYALLKVPGESGTTQLQTTNGDFPATPSSEMPLADSTGEDYATQQPILMPTSLPVYFSEPATLSPEDDFPVSEAPRTLSPGELAVIAALVEPTPSPAPGRSNRWVLFTCVFLFIAVFMIWLYRR